MNQRKHTTMTTNRAGDRTAKVLAFPSRPNMRARVSSDCEKQDLTRAGLADLLAAVFAHRDLDEASGAIFTG
jgi:hypothetical protein